MELWASTISALALILVAVIETRNNRSRKRTEERAKKREEESMLSMKLMSATCALSLVTAKKMAGHHTNGDVEEAMERAQKAQDDYNEFLRRQTARSVAQ